MSRRVFLLWLLAAMPGLLAAQEAKLVNCRTLEEAGNFIGSDEVLAGDKVCQKLKPGAAAPVKSEPAKPLPGAVISDPDNVVDAAKASHKKSIPAQEEGSTEPQIAPQPVAQPVSNSEPRLAAPKESVPAHTEPAPPPKEPIPPPPAKKPEVALPVNPPPDELAVKPEPQREERPAPSIAQPAPGTRSVSPVAASAKSAPVVAVPIRRDAPVAPGTPSAPPEKDYGFSDANAVEPVAPAQAATASTAAQTNPGSSAHRVKVGGFEKPPEVPVQPPAEEHAAGPPVDANGVQEGQRAGCTKNITLGSLQQEKFAIGTPAWAQTWIAKNQERMTNVCFSAAPVRGAQNYLIVFYIASVAGRGNSGAMPAPDAALSGNGGAFTTKGGSGWQYSAHPEANASDAADPAYSQAQVWYATAYTEDGSPVAERWPEPAGNTKIHAEVEHTSGELLNAIVEDLRKL